MNDKLKDGVYKIILSGIEENEEITIPRCEITIIEGVVNMKPLQVNENK